MNDPENTGKVCDNEQDLSKTGLLSKWMLLATLILVQSLGLRCILYILEISYE